VGLQVGDTCKRIFLKRLLGLDFSGAFNVLLVVALCSLYGFEFR
jgi:hypothetical protein